MRIPLTWRLRTSILILEATEGAMGRSCCPPPAELSLPHLHPHLPLCPPCAALSALLCSYVPTCVLSWGGAQLLASPSRVSAHWGASVLVSTRCSWGFELHSCLCSYSHVPPS